MSKDRNSGKASKNKNNPGSNKDLQGTDKAPGEERERKEKVTTRDLKNKTGDRDPEKE